MIINIYFPHKHTHTQLDDDNALKTIIFQINKKAYKHPPSPSTLILSGEIWVNSEQKKELNVGKNRICLQFLWGVSRY